MEGFKAFLTHIYDSQPESVKGLFVFIRFGYIDSYASAMFIADRSEFRKIFSSQIPHEESLICMDNYFPYHTVPELRFSQSRVKSPVYVLEILVSVITPLTDDVLEVSWIFAK